MDHQLDTNKVYYLVAQDEQKKGILTPEQESSIALLAQQHALFAQQHTNKPPRSQEGRERPYYTHYKRPGHTLNTCYQVHGYPDKGNTRNFSQNNQQRRNFKAPGQPYNNE